MNCNKCGTVNSPEALFCGNCGNNLKENNNPTPVVEHNVNADIPELPALAQAKEQTPASAPIVEPASPVVTPTPTEPNPVELGNVNEVTIPPAAPVVTPEAPVAPVPVAPVAPVVTPVENPVSAPAEPVVAPVTPNIDATQAITTPIIQNVMPAQPVAMPTTTVPGQTVVPVSAPKKGFNKKLLIPIFAIVAIITIVLGITLITNIFSGGTNEKASLEAIFDPKKPILIKEDDKYGYITYKGKELIDAKYDYASDFYGDYAIVAKENETSEDDYTEPYIYAIINQKGKEVLSDIKSVYQPQYYSEYGIWVINEKLYDSKLKQITNNDIKVEYLGSGYLTYSSSELNKSGIMNHKGKTIWTYDSSIISVELSDNKYDKNELYAEVSTYDEKDGSFILSLKNGKKVYSLDDSENYYISARENGIFRVWHNEDYDDETWLFVYKNKVVYEDDEISDLEVYDYKNQILELDYGYEVEYDEQYKYYDVKNKKMLDEEPETSSEDFEELDLYETLYGFKPYESSDKYGFMQGDKVLVPAEYEEVNVLAISPFNYIKDQTKQLLAFVEKDSKTTLINVKNKKEIITFEAQNPISVETSTFIEAIKYDDYERDGYIIYNLISGKQKEFDNDVDITLGSNYIIVTDGSDNTYYNTELEEIYKN